MASAKHITYARPASIEYWLRLIMPALQNEGELEGEQLAETAVAVVDKIITALVTTAAGQA